ncbi:MAG: GntR family carbon starvation induced transcriptional regulator [Paracoccaceae bacterium]
MPLTPDPRPDGSSDVRLDEGQTLAQAAYRALRIDIIRGVRPPGERLRIEKLKSIYNVGPTPLREALQMLSADQLVLAEGNRGFTVAPLDFVAFGDLNTARTAVETAALRLSVVHGDEAWEAGVVAASYIMRKEDAALAPSALAVPDSWERANAGFHAAMVAGCGSQWLLRIRADLHDQCERYRRASVYQKIGQRNLSAEHGAIAAAVLVRDADLACKLTARHFALTASSLSDIADASAPAIAHGRRR